ncbi:RNA 2',3'-cyclic phosphodiesterase [Denitratisoma sp. agr-D3]
MTDSSLPSGGAATQRVFFALWPPAAHAAQLHQTARHLANDRGGKAMAEATLHLTLAFLGSLDRAALARAIAVADALHGMRFDLTLDKLDYWPDKKILWAGCSQTPEALLSLARTLQDGLRSAGLSLPIGEGFTPHVTLLRHCPRGTAAPLTREVTWPVGEFLLVESRPEAGRAHYHPLRRWPLGPGAA